MSTGLSTLLVSVRNLKGVGAEFRDPWHALWGWVKQLGLILHPAIVLSALIIMNLGLTLRE